MRHGIDKLQWIRSFRNELGRLAQGMRDVKGTDCITFIHHKDIPKGQKIAHSRIACNIRPQKKETHRTRMTIGGNLLDYEGNTKTPTADLITLKLLINSVLSTPQAKFMTTDMKNFYLETALKKKQHVFLPADLLPDEITQACNLQDKIHNGKICMQINAGICGLKEAGALANQQPQQHLAPCGHAPSRCAPGLRKHSLGRVIFGSIVDDFAVKHTDRSQAEHLIQALKDKHEDIEVNWEGNELCGINLKWNFETRTCQLNIPNHTEKLR